MLCALMFIFERPPHARPPSLPTNKCVLPIKLIITLPLGDFALSYIIPWGRDILMTVIFSFFAGKPNQPTHQYCRIAKKRPKSYTEKFNNFVTS